MQYVKILEICPQSLLFLGYGINQWLESVFAEQCDVTVKLTITFRIDKVVILFYCSFV